MKLEDRHLIKLKIIQINLSVKFCKKVFKKRSQEIEIINGDGHGCKDKWVSFISNYGFNLRQGFT